MYYHQAQKCRGGSYQHQLSRHANIFGHSANANPLSRTRISGRQARLSFIRCPSVSVADITDCDTSPAKRHPRCATNPALILIPLPLLYFKQPWVPLFGRYCHRRAGMAAEHSSTVGNIPPKPGFIQNVRPVIG